jgi:hypothetical protein
MIIQTFLKLNSSNPIRSIKNKNLKEFILKQTFLKKSFLNSTNIQNSLFIKELQNDVLPFSQKKNVKKKWWKISPISQKNKEINYKYNYKQIFFTKELQENSAYFCYIVPNLNKENKIKLQLTQHKIFSLSKILFINKYNSFKFNLFKNIFIGKCCIIKCDNFFSKSFKFSDLKLFESNLFLLGAFINYKFIRPSEIEFLKKISLKKSLIIFLNLLQFQKNAIKFFISSQQ